ncbi:unnamed protein product, partial [Ceratitis capitata]
RGYPRSAGNECEWSRAAPPPTPRPSKRSVFALNSSPFRVQSAFAASMSDEPSRLAATSAS